MKRSEMLKIIHNLLEHAGMQPPEKWTTRVDTPFGELVFPIYEYDAE